MSKKKEGAPKLKTITITTAQRAWLVSRFQPVDDFAPKDGKWRARLAKGRADTLRALLKEMPKTTKLTRVGASMAKHGFRGTGGYEENPGDVHIDIHSHNTRGKNVRAKNPTLTKADHFDQARQNLFVWKAKQKEWLDVYRDAFRKTFGRDPSYGDTNISGIGNANLPEPTKEKLREINRQINAALDAAHAHYKASGKRSWLKFKEAETPAMKRAKNPAAVHAKHKGAARVVLKLVGHPKGAGYWTGEGWDTTKAKARAFDTMAGAVAAGKKLAADMPASYRIEVHPAGK